MGCLDTGGGSLGLGVAWRTVMETDGEDLVRESNASSGPGLGWCSHLRLSSERSQNLAARGRGFGLSSEVAGTLSVSMLGPLLSMHLGDPDMCWAQDTCCLSPWQTHNSWVPLLPGEASARLQGHAMAARGCGSQSRACLCSRHRRPAGFPHIYQCLCMFFLCGI